MHLLKLAKKIAVGVSGGVDSAVAAHLLKKQGHEVVGVFMRNWDVADETGNCNVDADVNDAAHICDKIGIPFQQVDFVKAYWNEVFDDLVNDYENRLTPNPDILCNKFIKFKRFAEFATEKLGCELIATGHYARRTFPDDSSSSARLLRGVDLVKDQTFFLSQIPQEALKKTLFPLGDLLKSQVKKIAFENGLERIASKKESMGMCFIGSRRFQHFIEDYIVAKEGVFVDVDTGKTLGRHNGQHHFTVGQRCKLGGLPSRSYVARKMVNEAILAASGHRHPLFFGRIVFTSPPHWIHSKPTHLVHGHLLRCQFRFQHREPPVSCAVFANENQELTVLLNEPLRALTPGQFSVFYSRNECLGSSRIKYAGPSEYVLNLVKNSNVAMSRCAPERISIRSAG
ncbi:tRNA methyl transferase [Nesidiocoris tenuis]|uniref:tRNA-5-taurinomethyluridine 2-sulfurtransferase n=1 Tax=Nesidiocoris tenuis TaxID=355587 RepID=A0ABN7AVU0_9HEMI|nr:tRNA methyl transferase [Nesidiocoris tenuis]